MSYCQKGEGEVNIKEVQELISYMKGQSIISVEKGKAYAIVGNTKIKLTADDVRAIQEGRLDTENLKRVAVLLENRVRNLQKKASQFKK